MNDQIKMSHSIHMLSIQIDTCGKVTVFKCRMYLICILVGGENVNFSA